MLNLPYNFVPLSRAILHPEWAPRVSHDHPFREGLSGELGLSITAETPLCAGGRQTKPTDSSPGIVHFFRTPESRLAIPGSTIKGMLRNVVEIASFGKFIQVDDLRFGVRDISKADNFYSKAMNRTPVNTGWLNYSNGRWYITPCSMERVEQEVIIDFFSIAEREWNRNKSAASRYGLLNGIRQVAFSKQRKPDSNGEKVVLHPREELSDDDSNHATEGYLVVTGQPGADFRKRGAKKRDFIFYGARASDAREIRQTVMADFMFIHEGGGEWAYWKGRMREQPPEPGIPVFYHEDSNGVRSIGLARMYRLAYENSVHDAVENTNKAHVNPTAPDLAQLIFGQLDEHDPTGANNLRGRLNVSLAETQTPDDESDISRTQAMVLSSPKPTFYPAYVDQSRGRGRQSSYKTMMDPDAELSGWKRYPVRDQAEVPTMSDLVARNPRVQVRLETAPPGTRFSAKMRFHNLLPAELGAVLWAIDFGANPHARHALGTGKPFGFGQVKLEVECISVCPNLDPGSEPEDPDLLADACRAAFENLMQGFWTAARAEEDDSNWKRSPQLVQLLAMSDPYVGRDRNWDYPTAPQSFMRAKQQGEILDRYVDPDQPQASVEARQGEFNIEHPADFSKLTEDAKDARQKEREQKQRAKEKETMSDDDRLIADVEDLLRPDEWTKSAFARLEKHLRSLLKISGDDFDPSQRDKLLVLGRGVHRIIIEHEKQGTGLDKALKKLFKHLDAEPPQ